MQVHPEYRTVILEAYPTPEQERVLRSIEEKVLRFIGFGRLEFQKQLYHAFKGELPSRLLSLLTKRFTGSLGEKAILPFDEDNSRFVFDSGAWFIEVQVGGRGDKRERILVSKTGVPYYDDIQDLAAYPFVLARENDRWFAYVSIPLEPKQALEAKVVGVDFNMGLWVASEAVGRPLLFRPSIYERQVEKIQRCLSRLYAEGKTSGEEVERLYSAREAAVRRAHADFLKAIRGRWGLCTLAVESVKTLYRLRENRDRRINSWLYTKTALRAFVMKAMVEGFQVVEVNPAYTSRKCHRCGAEVEARGRQISCPSCGLRNYNRDINAARNIALRAMPASSAYMTGDSPAHVPAGVGMNRGGRLEGISDPSVFTGSVKPERVGSEKKAEKGFD
jgi:predicted RNA-binding Zn-ribbon protein involved in translation (DUF1610 family)